MKLQTLLILIFLLLNSPAATATENETIEGANSSSVTDDIGRLSYFPPQNKFVLISGLSLNPSDKITLKNSSGATILSNNGSSQIASALLAFGIANNFTIGISGNYAFDRKSETHIPSTASTTTTHRSGISDPSLYIGSRLISNQMTGLFFDLALKLKPSLIKNKIPNGTTRGSNTSGTTAIELQNYLTFSKYDWFEYQTTLGLNLQTSGDGTGATSASDEHYNSVFSVNFDHSFRFHLDQIIYIEPSMHFYFPYTYTTTTSSGNLKEEDEIPFRAIPSVNFGFKCTDKLAVSAGLAYTSYGSDVIITSSGTQGRYTADSSSLGLQLGIQVEL